MRPLTAEEIQALRLESPVRLRPANFLVPMTSLILGIVSFVAGWSLFVGAIIGFVIPLLLLVLASQHAQRKRESDLRAGVAETVVGPVRRGRRFRLEGQFVGSVHCIHVANRRFDVNEAWFDWLADGQAVRVDFLPRSGEAVRIEAGDSR